jgi:5-methylcytosine-specific restriction protein A
VPPVDFSHARFEKLNMPKRPNTFKPKRPPTARHEVNPPSTVARQPRTRGRKWMRIRELVLSKNPLCVDCQGMRPPRVTLAEEVDHIIPLHQGGTDALGNLVGRCREHHIRKTAADASKKVRRRVGLDGLPIE